MQSYLIIMEALGIIAYLGGWAVLTVGLAAVIGRFLAKIIADNLKIKWSGEQEEKLEILRAEITREHSTFTAVLNSYSSIHKLSQSKRIEAVEILWANTLKLRDLSGFPALFFDSLFENEYNPSYNKKILMSGLNSLSPDSLSDKASTIFNNVEKYQPFLDEQLWNLFQVYYILLFRVVFKLIEGRDEKNIISWDKDKQIRLILDRTFTDEDRKSIPTPPKNMNPLTPTINLMKQKILFEIFKVISGELAAESDLSKAKELQEVLKLVEIPKNITK